MKIGQQGIDHPETVPRSNEQAGIAAEGPQFAAGRSRLEAAHHGGADRHHAPAARTRFGSDSEQFLVSYQFIIR